MPRGGVEVKRLRTTGLGFKEKGILPSNILLCLAEAHHPYLHLISVF